MPIRAKLTSLFVLMGHIRKRYSAEIVFGIISFGIIHTVIYFTIFKAHSSNKGTPFGIFYLKKFLNICMILCIYLHNQHIYYKLFHPIMQIFLRHRGKFHALITIYRSPKKLFAPVFIRIFCQIGDPIK